MPNVAPEKTALVVEDEMLFRLEVRDLLEAEGYAVVEAGSAAQALARLDDSMSLMVTDIRMPGAMDGLALVREVARRRPDLAVVVVSAQVTPKPEELPAGIPFVGRPFLESSLRAAMRDAVSDRGTTPP
ncbi:response regulator [Methylobacterium phyllostachyos]|nr:response regulator [Methylobacterium phyllostachyos]